MVRALTSLDTQRPQEQLFAGIYLLTLAVALIGYVLGTIDVAIAEQLLGYAGAIVTLPLVVQTGCIPIF